MKRVITSLCVITLSAVVLYGFTRTIVTTINRVVWETDTDFNKGSFSLIEVSGTDDAAVIQPEELIDETTNINYTTTNDYTVSNPLFIVVANNEAKLLALSGESFDWPFVTSSSYTFNSGTITVTGGVAKLIDQTPTNGTFYANFESSTTASWANGELTGVPSGGIGLTGGKLDLAQSDGRGIIYQADQNFDSQQVGAIRFLVTPNYSGNAPSRQFFVYIFDGTGSLNRLRVVHEATGQLNMYMTDGVAGSIFYRDLGVWNPTAGVEYEFEFNYDVTAGASRLFVDGVQFGITETGTGTRSSDITSNRIGSVGTQNFFLDDILVFDTVQHTANYTPGAAIPQERFITSNPVIETNFSFAGSTIPTQFIATTTVTGSDSVRYQLSPNDGSDYSYWTGSSWSVTTEDFNNTNTADDVQANIGALASSGSYVFKAFLHSDDGNSTPQLDNVHMQTPIVFSTMDDLYVDTENGSQVSPSTPIVWLALTISTSLPADTTATILLSNDSRVTWQVWDGDSWEIIIDSVTRSLATGFSDAQVNFPSFDLGNGTIDARVFLKTNISTVTPTVTNIAVESEAGFAATGTWTSNEYSSTFLDQQWQNFRVLSTLPSGTTITYKVKTANTSTELGLESFLEVQPNTYLNIFGQIIQFEITMISSGTIKPTVDNFGVRYTSPPVPDRVAP